MFKLIHRIMMPLSKIKTAKLDPFLNLAKPAIGLTQDLTFEQRQKIDQQITNKMNELQSTGLSRQEILLSKSQKGIPLKIDPFFQFIKRNIRARQIYLKQNDRYNVENIIDIALRQDIGPDPSYSRIRQSDKFQAKGRADELSQLKQKKKETFDPKSFEGSSNFTIQRAFDEIKPHQPLRHYFKPVDRYEKRKMNLRTLKKYDIHWRNVQLLSQFLTKNNNIKSRYKSLVSDGDQRTIKKAVKTARVMGTLPYYGRTPTPLKKNMTSLQDQVQQIGYQHVNLQTGHLFQTRSKSMDAEELQIKMNNDLDMKYNKMLKEGKNYKLWVDTLKSTNSQSELLSERYAKHIKMQQIETRSKQVELKKNIKQVLQNIKKFKGLISDQLSKTKPSNDQNCQKQFNIQKQKIKLQAKENPLSILDALLQDKYKQ